ncbi:hypothetical protein Hanom_Chr12g01112961 [Helianthus anomalus]
MVQCLDRKFETQRKRSKRLFERKWSEVINLDDSKDNVSGPLFQHNKMATKDHRGLNF